MVNDALHEISHATRPSFVCHPVPGPIKSIPPSDVTDVNRASQSPHATRESRIIFDRFRFLGLLHFEMIL